MKKLILIMITTTLVFAGINDKDYKKTFDKKIEELRKDANFIEPLILKSVLNDKKSYDSLYILDVRGANEVQSQGHIKAEKYINIPRGLVEFKINKNIEDLNEILVIVCYTEMRSLFVNRSLKDLGYKNIQVLKGGMEKWNRECLPRSDKTNLFFQDIKKGSCGGKDTPQNIFKLNRSVIK